MSQCLPIDGFEWEEDLSVFTSDFIKGLEREGTQGFFIEATVNYPKELHNLHDEFPLCPEHREITEEDLSPFQQEQANKLGLRVTKSRKLIASLHNKKKYVFHFWTLIQCLKLGMELESVTKVLKFNQSPFLRSYVDLCMRKRRNADNPFDMRLAKLMVCIIFTIVNIIYNIINLSG